MQNPFQHINDVLSYSGNEAHRLMWNQVHTEHLVLGILHCNNKLVNDMLEHFGINAEVLRSTLYESLDMVQKAQGSQGNIPSNLEYTQETQDVISGAIIEARLCNGQDAQVQPEHLLLSLLKRSNSAPAKMLIAQGLTYEKLFNYINGINPEIEDKLNKLNQEVENYKRSKATKEPELNEEEATADDVQAQSEDEESDTATMPKESKTSEQEDNYISPDEEPFDFCDNNDANANKNSKGPNIIGSKKSTKSNTPMLDKFSIDLTKAAKEGKLDPVVGRDKEVTRVMEILGRRKKNNPVLIGEPGVGKSAIVEGLAQAIINGERGPMFFGKRILSLDLTSIIAGTKYRGSFEERLKGIIKELEKNQDIIIFIDEIHTIIGAGGAEGTLDVANTLKPALARGTIQCIGATTLDEYRKSIEKDGALERRFQKVIVEPTTPEETLQILHNIKSEYERHHSVTYTEEALKACVKLTDRYVHDRFFPDKAIDLMDEAGAHVHISNGTVPKELVEAQKQLEKYIEKKQMAVSVQNFEMAACMRDEQAECEKKIEEIRKAWKGGGFQDSTPVDENEIANTFSRMMGIPVQKMAESENAKLKNMSNLLKSEVIAQDDAIDKVVKAIKRNRMGLRDPNHPIGAFMFLGPTGVGKTYLAKKLAEEMFGSDDALFRIDMSEYAEGFNTSRLIGSPPGYVGYDEGGQLTEKVRRKPYSIVLLDEIEKANKQVFNLLLQVLDEGRLTDGNGRLIDFRNTIIIMTSNAGTRQLKEFGRGVGFNAGGLSSNGTLVDEKDKEYARNVVQKNLEKQFAPEFLNRLDEIITFDQLDLNAIKRIVDLELKSLVKRVENMGYHFQMTDKAKEFVATKGYDVQFGARPLKRAIQTYVEDGLCELLMEGNLQLGDTINIGKNPKKDELTFK